MLHQRYETQADLDAEADIVAAAVRHLNLAGARKLDERYYVLDHALLDEVGDIRCFAECKARSWPYGAGNGLFISLFKVMRCRQLAHAAGVPAYIVPRFRGGEIYCANFLDHDREAFIWGRGDHPTDPNAQEPTLCFPWSAFVRIGP
jgi:hypothetical protein